MKISEYVFRPFFVSNENQAFVVVSLVLIIILLTSLKPNNRQYNWYCCVVLRCVVCLTSVKLQLNA